MPRALGFRGSPGKLPAGRVDRGSGRRAGIQTERKAVRRIVRTGGRCRKRKLRQLIHRLIANCLKHRRLNDHPKRRHVGHLRRTIVTDADRYGVGAAALLARRRPAQHAADRVEVHSRWCSRFQAKRQRVGRQIRIRGRNGHRQRLSLVDRLLADGVEHWRQVHLLDGYGKSRYGVQGRHTVVGHADGNRVCVRPLVLRGCPGKLARVRIDLRSKRGTRIEREGKLANRQVRIRCGNRQRQRVSLVERLILDRVDNRRQVDLGHDNREGRRVANSRNVVVGHADDDGIGSRPLFFGRCPRKETAGRIDCSTRRREFFQAEDQLSRRIAGMRGRCRQRQRVAFVDYLVANRIQHGRFQGHVE